LFDTPAAFNTVVILTLAVLVLVPIRFLYVTHLPNRSERRRHYTLAGLWGVMCVVALLMPPGPTRDAVAVASLAYPAYYVYCSVRSDLDERRHRP
jgi:phosphatidylcholine synthase